MVGPGDLVAPVSSWSSIANLPAPRRAALLAEIGELVAHRPQLTLGYRTEILWTRATSPGG